MGSVTSRLRERQASALDSRGLVWMTAPVRDASLAASRRGEQAWTPSGIAILGKSGNDIYIHTERAPVLRSLRWRNWDVLMMKYMKN